MSFCITWKPECKTYGIIHTLTLWFLKFFPLNVISACNLSYHSLHVSILIFFDQRSLHIDIPIHFDRTAAAGFFQRTRRGQRHLFAG